MRPYTNGSTVRAGGKAAKKAAKRAKKKPLLQAKVNIVKKVTSGQSATEELDELVTPTKPDTSAKKQVASAGAAVSKKLTKAKSLVVSANKHSRLEDTPNTEKSKPKVKRLQKIKSMVSSGVSNGQRVKLENADSPLRSAVDKSGVEEAMEATELNLAETAKSEPPSGTVHFFKRFLGSGSSSSNSPTSTDNVASNGHNAEAMKCVIS